MNNQDLYDFAEAKGITVDLMSVPENKSMSVELDGEYFIALDEKTMENSADERVHFAHELGHCEEGEFYYIYAPELARKKQEAQATRWAVKKLIPKNEFITLLKKGYQKWDLAEHFNVTEDFIETAYNLYFEVGIN